MGLVLASASPRRQSLLAHLGVPFEVMAADIDESVRAGETPADYVRRMALEKAQVVQARLGANADSCVLGADTSVVLGDRILGKPVDRTDALQTLQSLAGGEHQVLTGVAVVTGSQHWVAHAQATVVFGDYSPAVLAAYWETGEPIDKAGSYALQGIGGALVEQVVGHPTTVIGLPLPLTARLLAQAGIKNWLTEGQCRYE